MSDKLNFPRFAVVGHPNKGKSSLVAALTRRDDVAISDYAGTTKARRAYRLEVDGEVLLELIDTPGFQRARTLLAWLDKHQGDALLRSEAIAAFVAQHREDETFADEVELLTPIVEGAGIIYVVDGSKPYSADYEAEMEILRRCGRPSLAVINRIDDKDYTDAWRKALSGYFNIVRTYNPVKARLQDHLALLEALGHADERWLPMLQKTVRRLKTDDERKLQQSARIIVQALFGALTHKETLRLMGKEPGKREREMLQERYKTALRRIETQARRDLKEVWRHRRIDEHGDDGYGALPDLFSKESASIFGLSKKELLLAGALTGAATGAGIDMLFVGHTLFAGGAIGAVAGAAGAYLAFDKLADVRILGRQAGSYVLEIGGIKERNFPYILTGRLMYAAYRLATLSHADRSEVDLTPDASFRHRWMDDATSRKLENYFAKIRKGKAGVDEKARMVDVLTQRLQRLLEEV